MIDTEQEQQVLSGEILPSDAATEATAGSGGASASNIVQQSALLSSLLALAACGGGGGGGAGTASGGPGTPGVASTVTFATSGAEPPQVAVAARPSAQNAARFLTQASFGAKSVDEIEALRVEGFERWIWAQFNAPTLLHTSYLDAQKVRETKQKATDDMSYEAVWQQWLNGSDQLRGRVTFALGQILVISNIAPDIRPYAMSSYMDMLNRNAFGNYRTLLREVTLHPAMGYYLNIVASEKDDAARGHSPQ